jgi:hypothetical protein
MSDDWNRTPRQEELYDATIATITRRAAEIAAAPVKERDALFEAARVSYQEAFEKVGRGDPLVAQWVDVTMTSIRLLVEEMDINGGRR